ncbi:Uncharacterized peptidase YqjE [hydrothermal vent metagenome]|uniref:Uncharacterized peptidase YqjE n=1 Tax=hydrothermal vent metagenome TaxID=652676 RepID=A0A3B0VBM3_9ZZZZ
MKIDSERLAANFITLCETDSPSRREGRVAALLREIFTELGADEIVEDDSARTTGSDSGNLFIRFNGTLEREAVFFNCHMDTVEPATGVRVRREGDTFFSAGDTILGSDDKSGIAALIEAMRLVRAHRLDHGPLEFIFTTCEEIGLLGAKALDPAMIKAGSGYALDSSGFGRVILGAPAANRLHIILRGVAAHAGLHPERGISAIKLAALAIAAAPCGRINRDSSINFGTIRGGEASNIVPAEVVIDGEIRSHSSRELDELTGRVREVFRQVVDNWQDPGGEARGTPELIFESRLDFPVMKLQPDDPVVRLVAAAARLAGLDLKYESAGGGSDANIFNGYGRPTAIIATGMTNVHSTDEQVSLRDLAGLTKLLVALMTM